MTEYLMRLAARTGAKGNVQRVVAGLIALALLIALSGAVRGALAVFDWFNDRGAVSNDRNKNNARVRSDQVDAERGAMKARQMRDAAEANEQANLIERIDDARTNRSSALDAIAD
ncbi:hypothetical protein [Sphingosinithalassobacter portus]|uniref:hypothetical protein n=1 Tax=Stakelama portus TaxID=2676234 RepID=UPI000D6E58AA|nr:hypothetical protein [Sphingosinithalassobacter portus]